MAWGRTFARKRRGGGIGGALAGLAAGAGLAYFLDPVRGAARRAWTIDRARRAAQRTERVTEARARDLGHRARGAAHEARARLAHEVVPDEVLVERVRARLGRLVAHPRAIEVVARGGEVELGGPVFRAELAGLLGGARAVRGVREVRDRLRPHDSAEGVPALQGRGPLAPAARRAWPGGAAAVAVAVGSAAAARALLGGRLLGIPAAVTGAALARGAVQGSLSRAGRGARSRERAASRAQERARERERDREAHEGAWHPEPGVVEVKSPAELQPGIVHASPEPTYPERVARGAAGRSRGRPSGGEAVAEPPPEASDVPAPEREPRSGRVAPAPGAGVRGDDLGAVEAPDASEPSEPGRDGEPGE